MAEAAQPMTEVDLGPQPPSSTEIPMVPETLPAIPASTVEETGFVSTDATAIPMGDELEGDMASDPATKKSSQFGNSFLNNKGFGWMMELDDDDDDEEQKPLLEELDIDLKDIWHKVRCVLMPVESLGFKRSLVREQPDFWGPLLVVLAFAMLSMWGNLKSTSWIITIWFFGSWIIYYLVRVLGDDVSFSQSLGIVGYSLLPLVVIILLMPAIYHIPLLNYGVKTLGVLWCAQSAGSLLVTEKLSQKKVLVLYPVALLYCYFLSLYSGA
eukprot:m.339089 g.339089  ORF g.339089 m.339089 type:complete len:269 (+) comp18656_c0_seq1:274-1080(+)